MHPTNEAKKIETSLLSIFRWSLIVGLFLLIITSVASLSIAVYKLPFTTPDHPKFKEAQEPVIKIVETDFISKISYIPKEKTTTPQTNVPAVIAPDSSEATFRNQSEMIWEYVSKYQTDCEMKAPLNKDEFLESLRQTSIKRILEQRGGSYANDQVRFIKSILSNADIIKLCKGGKAGILFSAIEYHREQWDKQIKDAENYEATERDRIQSAWRSKVMQSEEDKAIAMKLFLASAIAFGLFMSIALFLVFARIEANLRGTINVRTIREREDGI